MFDICKSMPHEMIKIAHDCAQLYASFLALLSVTAGIKRARTATTHLVVILGTVFAVYAYRDLWPLLTFTKMPSDLRDGSLLWAKLAVLGLVAIVIPLTVPRQYIPHDAQACHHS